MGRQAPAGRTEDRLVGADHQAPLFLVRELEEQTRERSTPDFMFPSEEGGPICKPNFNRRHWQPALRRADQQGCQKGLTDWGYSPGQQRLTNVVDPLFLREGRVNNGGGRMGPKKGRLVKSFRPPLRPPTLRQARRRFQKTSPDLRIVCRAGEI